MTNDTSYRQKGRAVFLAAIMVLSMVAGAAVLTGSAAAQDATIDIGELDGDVYFGQEVQINVSDGADNVVELRTDDDANELVDRYNTGGSDNITIDTSELDSGTYLVDDGETNGTFEVLTQDVSFGFSDDSVATDGSTNLVFESDNRAEEVDVLVDAGGDLSSDELDSIFADSETTDEDNEVRITGVTENDEISANFEAAEVDAGNYSFNVEVEDTGASDTANITVQEASDVNAEFTQGTFNEEVGDNVDFSFNTTDLDEVYVQVEDEHGVLNSTFNVSGYEDGTETLTMDSYRAGWDNVSNTFSADEGEIENVSDNSGLTSDDRLLPSRVNIYLYNGNPADGGEQLDRGIIRLQESSLDSATTYVAPGGTSVDRSSLLDVATEREDVAAGDIAVVEIAGSGYHSYLTNGTHFDTEEQNLSITIEDTAQQTYGSAASVEIGSNQDLSEVDGVSLIQDAANNTVYVAVMPSNLESDDADTEFSADSTLEVAFNVGEDNSYVDADESVNSTFNFNERNIEFDLETNDDDVLQVPNEDGASISGTSTAAPGTEVSVSAFFDTEILDGTAEVGEDGSWSTEFDLGGYDSGTQFSMQASESGSTDGDVSNANTGELDAVIGDAGGNATASFGVSASAEDSVEQDGDAQLGYSFSNDGDAAGDVEYTVTVGGEEVDSGTANLSAGDSTDTMTHSFDTSEAGDVEWTVETQHDSTSGTLTVEEGPGDDTGGDDTGGDDTGGDDTGGDDTGGDDTGADDDGDGDDGDDGGQPGFGLIVALFALIGAALLALRRQN